MGWGWGHGAAPSAAALDLKGIGCHKAVLWGHREEEGGGGGGGTDGVGGCVPPPNNTGPPCSKAQCIEGGFSLSGPQLSQAWGGPRPTRGV